MTINRDLFLAILSLDSYNRGYGAGIKFLSSAHGTMLGNATIQKDANDEAGISVAAGFYALSYSVSGVDGIADNSTVISYRGTDNNLGTYFGEGGSDLLNGYSLGAGDYLATQADLALKFYQSVTGFADGNDPFAANVTLTGHSLGGGLAGYVGKLYRKNGVVFNNMAFELATAAAYGESLVFADTYAYLYGTNVRQAPSSAGLTAFATTGEFLHFNRVVQSLHVTDLDSYGGLRSPFLLHSVALNVALQYAKSLENDDWHAAAPVLWDAFFGTEIAKVLPKAAEIKGQDVLDGVVRSAIAYSALDAGTRPFGDTGIAAMFNDANDLGRPLKNEVNLSSTLARAAGSIGQIIVQYAAQLALGGVVGGAASKYADGVLDLDWAGGILSIDLSASTWAAGAAHTSIVGRRNLIGEALSETEADLVLPPDRGTGFVAPPPTVRSDLLTGLNWLYAGKPGFTVADPTGVIDRVILKTTNAPYSGTLPRRALRDAEDGITLFASGDGADNITGSADDELLHGGGGADFIRGGAGDDLVAGGGGNDVLSGGTGKDFIAGGDGADIYDLRFEGASVTQNFTAFLGLVTPPSGSAQRVTGSIAFAFAGDGANAGEVEVNHFIDVETIRFSGAADRLTLVSPDFSDLASGNSDLIVDMGNRTGGNQSEADYDTVSYAPRGGNGVFWYDGSTHGAGSGGLVYAAATTLPFFSAVALRPIFLAESALPDDDLIIKGQENIILSDAADRFAFTNNDYTLHSGYGKIEGRGGGDILIYDNAKFIKAGTNGATDDLQLTLDGGAGKDVIYASGGERATTLGGTGRDWIFNTSANGIIYGDTVDGLDPLTHNAVADDKSNSDNIWYWADTTLMDAQHADVLKYFGIPLTGGDANGGLAGLIVNGLAGAAIGFGNYLRYLSGEARGWQDEIYVDHLQPWMIYAFRADEDDNLDLYITNAFEEVFRAFAAQFGGADQAARRRMSACMDTPCAANDDAIDEWRRVAA
jgi:RTX calcium-binding nonapeptide repeat (4 copies)